VTRVILDRQAGFCSGVKRTIRGAREALKEKKKVVSYGELIHNPDVTESLRRSGIEVRQSLEEIGAEDYVIIRAHGICPREEEALIRRGIPYADLTCLRVKQIHRRIAEKRAQGYTILIVGDPQHPEVKGHLGYAGAEAGMVISRPEQAELIAAKGGILVLAQTTTSPELFREVVRLLKAGGAGVQTLDTLCPFVLKRQRWIRRFSRLAEASLVIGGRNSSNTEKLVRLAAQNGPAYWIQNLKELDAGRVLSHSTLALTAGASTPQEDIREVVAFLRERGAKVEPC